MADIKSRAQDINPNAEARNIADFVNITGNIYESLVIIGKRANFLNNEMREELHSKLEEFATVSDSFEEIQENKEQVEISKFYERLPNPALIATDEFKKSELSWRNPADEKEEETEEG
jgi:DNA-directed RNA polymerase subunit K/omega